MTSLLGHRILILVPHPDDEIVGCAALIQRARAAGATVRALYLTHGCIDRAVRWPWDRKNHDQAVARRRAEAERAAALLGITPVGWSERPARHLWRDLPQVLDEVLETIEAHVIDQVWLPAYEGGNADHDGLNAVGACLARRGVSVIECAEYNYAQGRAQAQTFPFPNGTETIITLTPDEQKLKRAALDLYVSEQCNLGYVGCVQESYRPLASYDYSRPAHEGTLWYARFQWVPFRHPRVDFTKPADVSAAIGAFLDV